MTTEPETLPVKRLAGTVLEALTLWAKGRRSISMRRERTLDNLERLQVLLSVNFPLGRPVTAAFIRHLPVAR
jgi:hypothetical protein